MSRLAIVFCVASFFALGTSVNSEEECDKNQINKFFDEVIEKINIASNRVYHHVLASGKNDTRIHEVLRPHRKRSSEHLLTLRKLISSMVQLLDGVSMTGQSECYEYYNKYNADFKKAVVDRVEMIPIQTYRKACKKIGELLYTAELRKSAVNDSRALANACNNPTELENIKINVERNLNDFLVSANETEVHYTEALDGTHHQQAIDGAIQDWDDHYSKGQHMLAKVYQCVQRTQQRYANPEVPELESSSENDDDDGEESIASLNQLARSNLDK